MEAKEFIRITNQVIGGECRCNSIYGLVRLKRTAELRNRTYVPDKREAAHIRANAIL